MQTIALILHPRTRDLKQNLRSKICQLKFAVTVAVAADLPHSGPASTKQWRPLFQITVEIAYGPGQRLDLHGVNPVAAILAPVGIDIAMFGMLV